MKKYLFLMCFTLFLFSCNHDNGNGKTDGQTLLPPSGVKAVATENVGELKITWDQVANNSGYEVHYKNTKSNENKTQAISKDVVLATLTGLEGGTEYEVSLKTKGNGKSFLDSPTSIVVKATPKNGGGGTKLNAPNNLKVVALNKGGALYASWDAVENNNGYSIKLVASGENEKIENVAKDEKFASLEGLVDGKEYSVSIMTKATSGFSPSDYSEIVKCKTLDSSDALVLEKIEIEGQEDVVSTSFTETAVNEDGHLRFINPNPVNFKITEDEKTIKPIFAGSNLKSYEIYLIEGLNKKKLENNKIKFEKDHVYSFEIVAKTNKELVVSYEFEGRALEVAFDVAVLYLKSDYSLGDTPSKEALEEVATSTNFQINPKLRNSKDLKLNVKKDDNLGENQKFLFLLSLDDDNVMKKIEFDGVVATSELIEMKNYYYKVLTPDSTGKAVLNAKFTLKSGAVEDRKYEFTKSDKNIKTEVKAIVFGDQEFAPVAMPSCSLAVFVPKTYKGKTYRMSVKLENNATYDLYFEDKGTANWKKVAEGSELKIEGEEDEINLDITPEIGKGLYDWTEVSVKIIVGAKKADNPKDILIGEVSVKEATTKEKAVAIDLNDIEAITIKLTDKQNGKFENVATLCTIEEYRKFLALNQREKLIAEIGVPTEDDFSDTEGKEFVIILTHDDAEGFEDGIYHVWLKKK